MKKRHLFLLVSFLFFLCFFYIPLCHAQFETVSISTYYPAPYGIYFELRAARLAVGSYYKSTGAGCYAWGGGGGCTAISNTANLVVDGIVGIGTPSPDVNHALTINGVAIAALLWQYNGAPIGFLGARAPNAALIGSHTTANGPLIFRTGGADRMYLDNQGTLYYYKDYRRSDNDPITS